MDLPLGRLSSSMYITQTAGVDRQSVNKCKLVVGSAMESTLMSQAGHACALCRAYSVVEQKEGRDGGDVMMRLNAYWSMSLATRLARHCQLLFAQDCSSPGKLE